MEAHIKPISKYTGYQPLANNEVVFVLDCVSNLFKAPDVLLILFEVLNCAHY